MLKVYHFLVTLIFHGSINGKEIPRSQGGSISGPTYHTGHDVYCMSNNWKIMKFPPKLELLMAIEKKPKRSRINQTVAVNTSSPQKRKT